MKRYFCLILSCILIAFFIPVIVSIVIKNESGIGRVQSKQSVNDSISVFFHEKGQVKDMPIDEYLYGVLCAEMPASFEYEALKAQAVAARSYAMYKSGEVSPEHPTAEVCTDASHCKAYKPVTDFTEKWGENATKYKNKIQNAVLETHGEVITYKGDVALAVFHSQSGGGKTENSSDVWGKEVPYLVSVESHGEESAPNFHSRKICTFQEFKSIIENANQKASVNSTEDIGICIKSEGGSVESAEIGGVDFKGTEIRNIFGLRSSCFEISIDENNVVFDVVGYGHGVGMSQYGANAMAKEGCDYREILSHYYTGIEITEV